MNFTWLLWGLQGKQFCQKDGRGMVSVHLALHFLVKQNFSRFFDDSSGLCSRGSEVTHTPLIATALCAKNPSSE